MRTVRRSTALVATLLGLTFVSGIAVGVAVDRRLGVAASATAPYTSDQNRTGRFTIEQYADELGLSQEQRAQIAPILESVLVDLEALADEMRPRAMAVGDSAKGRIKALLTSEQVEEYDSLLREREWAERERHEDRLKKLRRLRDNEGSKRE